MATAAPDDALARRRRDHRGTVAYAARPGQGSRQEKSWHALGLIRSIGSGPQRQTLPYPTA